MVAAETSLLRAAGHHVWLEEVSNDSIVGFKGTLAAFFHSQYNHGIVDWVRDLVSSSGAEVVHVHNFFPLLSPSVHKTISGLGLPVVQSLHNYRPLCAAATFLRDGKVCEKCLQGSGAWAVVHCCYRGSALGSLSVVGMQHRARRERIWHDHVHAFVALTHFARDKFIAGGFPSERIAVKPNFVEDPGTSLLPRAGALFVGRISHEKGVDTLLSGWKSLDIPLTVVGDGPDLEGLKSGAPPNVTFLGGQPTEKVLTLMKSSRALIVPSIWYEGFPVTVVEAFACGLPVIASGIGSLSEIVQAGKNGDYFVPNDAVSLAAVVASAFQNSETLHQWGFGARESYERHYTAERNLRMLESVYDDAADRVDRTRSRIRKS